MNSRPLNFVQAGAHRVAYVEGGEQSGGPKVLISHGWIASHQLYRKVFADLDQLCHYRCIDLVGFGDSDKPDPSTTPYNPDWYGEQLEAFLDATGWDKCIVVSQSMGCLAASAFTLRAPQRVEKLILIDGAGVSQPPPLLGKILQTPGLGGFLFKLLGGTRKSISDFLKNDVYHVQSAFEEKVIDDMLRIINMPGGNAAAYATMMRMVSPKAVDAFTPRLSGINVPTRLIWGEHDKLFPVKACAEKMRDLIPNATLEVVPGSGHEPPVETPTAFVEAFKRALTS